MRANIGGVMSQCPERESIFVKVGSLTNKVRHEIAAARVMRQVAEEFAAKRVIADVLNQTAPIRESMRSAKILRCGRRKTFAQDWLNFVLPNNVDDLLVSEKGIGQRSCQKARDQEQQTKRYRNETRHPFVPATMHPKKVTQQLKEVKIRFRTMQQSRDWRAPGTGAAMSDRAARWIVRRWPAHRYCYPGTGALRWQRPDPPADPKSDKYPATR